MLAALATFENRQREEAYRREQAALPFNQRDIPVTNADVLRLGGTQWFEQGDFEPKQSSAVCSEDFRFKSEFTDSNQSNLKAKYPSH